MAADDIRIAWNLVTESLHALHEDDGTYSAAEIGFGQHRADSAPQEMKDRAMAPGGPRLVLGPTLGEIREAFERRPLRKGDEDGA